MNCLQCQCETKNPKFCSRSCSAKYTNTINPKRKKVRICKSCPNLIGRGRTYCKSCRGPRNDDPTLGSLILKYSKHHRSSAFVLIRTRARAIADSIGWKSCVKCGYDKHIEIAHIKPISSYSDDTLISVINKVDNLIPLCPNCHWEFDN